MTQDTDIPTVIKRPLPNAVTYDLSTAGQVTITLPESSTWSSGLHWHESHDEYLKVVKGTIRVQLGNSTRLISATDKEQPEIKVARFEWHEWQRAVPDGEVVVIERTEPVDNEKAIFFWNLNGVILNAPKLLDEPSILVSRLPPRIQGLLLDFWITLNLFVIFYHLDNFPVFLNVSNLVASRYGDRVRNKLKRLDWIASHIILYSASWLGWILGMQPVQPRYTPAVAYASWWLEKEERGKKRAHTK